MKVLHFYQIPGLSEGIKASKLKELQEFSADIIGIETEKCFNVNVKQNLNKEEIQKLLWLLSCPLNPDNVQREPFLVSSADKTLIEIGPR